MKTSPLFIALLSGIVVSAQGPSSCSQDACVSFLSGGNNSYFQSSLSADCSRYLYCTVTPPATTVVVTTTLTTSSPATNGQASAAPLTTSKPCTGKGSQKPATTGQFSTACRSDMSFYVSRYCGASTQTTYSSACACIVPGPFTTTIPPPGITNTDTVEVPASETTGQCSAPTSMANASPEGSCGCPYRSSACGRLVCDLGQSAGTQHSQAECESACDNSVSCRGYAFNAASGACNMCVSDDLRVFEDPAWAYGIRVPEIKCSDSDCEY